MATSDGFPLFVLVFLSIFYSAVSILSIVGNIWVIKTCYMTLKRRYFPVMWLLANLASADLLFIFLTFFNIISFFWRWVGGDVTCKLHGFLVEATYTVSITTLAVITYQRLKAITDPFNSRVGSWPRREFLKIILIWFLCLAVCTPLVHIYRVEIQSGDVVCVNTTWGNDGRQIYYSLHATLFFIAPLAYMIFTQTQIKRALRSRVEVISNSFIEKSNRRNKKIAKTLAALTIAFVVCWSPFMITRTLIYFHLASPGLVWRASQLLICLNAALDPLLYGYFGGNLKSGLRRLLNCNYMQRRDSNLTSLAIFRTNALIEEEENKRGVPS